jgi:hypothetical protein
MIPTCEQCCQHLANVFGQINLKIRPLANTFGRTDKPLIEAEAENIVFIFTRYLVKISTNQCTNNLGLCEEHTSKK